MRARRTIIGAAATVALLLSLVAVPPALADAADSHEDGPTEPLTRHLDDTSPSIADPAPATRTQSAARSLSAATTSSLPAALGPQPVFRFPFAPGARWGASGSHSDSDGVNRGAIDFAPLSSSTTTVRAIAAGKVYKVSCSGGWFLGIDHGGGWLSEYYHLKNAKSSLVGTWVEAGTALGTAGQTLPCGGTPGDSAHVHLSILNTTIDVPTGKRKYIAVSGIQFDRYRLTDSTGAYNGVWKNLSGTTVLTSKRVTCCLTASSVVGPATPKPTLPDVNGNGIDDRSELTAWNTDVDDDGDPDIVAFTASGVLTSRFTGKVFSGATSASSKFGSAEGWSTSRHPRMVVDVNGDDIPDLVGFSDNGVTVALGSGSGTFGTASRWLAAFGAKAGWTLTRHVRTLADVTGDGLPDVVGFGSNGVVVSVNTGSSFAAPKTWTSAFGANATSGGWNTTQHTRLVRDVNGDGQADIVGFGASGVQVSLSTGTGFAEPRSWSAAFGADRGWRADVTPRLLADVTGDGLPDVVGFARSGVFVARGTGTGFATASKWSGGFGLTTSTAGWKTDRDPRTLADVTGDGILDIVGFRSDGVYVAAGTGSRFGAAKRWTTSFGSREWTLGSMPRAVVDVNGDGRADIVGFGRDGVHLSLSTGSRFPAPVHAIMRFGRDASSGSWTVTATPRGIALG